MRSSGTRYSVSTSSRDTDPGQWQFLEKIYSNYQEISAQQKEIAERKWELDIELIHANKDEIGAIICADDGQGTARLGDWDTYERVQYIIKKFVYSRSRDMKQIADVELALKDRLELYGTTCAEQKKYIESLEASLTAVQEELAGLMNIMQLRAKEYQATKDACAVKSLQVVQLQRERDTILNLSEMDERAICKDFRALVKVNKSLERENMQLRAMLSANSAADLNAISAFMEGGAGSLQEKRKSTQKNKRDSSVETSKETDAIKGDETGIAGTDDVSRRDTLVDEHGLPLHHHPLADGEAADALEVNEHHEATLSASRRKTTKKIKNTESSKSGAGKSKVIGHSATAKRGTANEMDSIKASRDAKTSAESRQEESLSVPAHSGGALVPLLHSVDESAMEKEDDESSDSSELMNDEDRARYLIQQAPISALMMKLRKERSMWRRHIESSERASFSNLDYDTEWALQARLPAKTDAAATNTDPMEKWEKWDHHKHMDTFDARTDISWKTDTRTLGIGETSFNSQTFDAESVLLVEECKRKGSKKKLTSFIDLTPDLQRPQSGCNRSRSSSILSTVVDTQQESRFNETPKKRGGKSIQATSGTKELKNMISVVTQSQGSKGKSFALSSKYPMQTVKHENDFANATLTPEESSLRDAASHALNHGGALKKKPLHGLLSGEILEGHKANSRNLGAVTEEALRLRDLLHSARDEAAVVGHSHRLLRADMDEFFHVLGNALHALASGNALEFMQAIANEREAFEAQVTESVIGDMVEQRVADRLAKEGIVLQRHKGHPTKLTNEQWAQNKLYDAITKYSREDITRDIIKDVQLSEKDAVSQGSHEALLDKATGKGARKAPFSPDESSTTAHPKVDPFHESTSNEKVRRPGTTQLTAADDEDTWERFIPSEPRDDEQDPYGRNNRNNSDDESPEAYWDSVSASWTSLGVGASAPHWGALPALPHQQESQRIDPDLPWNMGSKSSLNVRGVQMSVPLVKQGARPTGPSDGLLPGILNRIPLFDWDSWGGGTPQVGPYLPDNAGDAGAWDKEDLAHGRLVHQLGRARYNRFRNARAIELAPLGIPTLQINVYAPNKALVPAPPRFNGNILEYLRALRRPAHIPILDFAPAVYRYDFNSALERIQERVQRSVNVALQNLHGPAFEHHFGENILPYARVAKLLQSGQKIMPWACQAIQDLRVEEESRRRRRTRILFTRILTNMRARKLLKCHRYRGSAMASFLIVLWNKWKKRSRSEEEALHQKGMEDIKKIMSLLSADQRNRRRVPHKQNERARPPPGRNPLVDPSSRHFDRAQLPHRKDKEV